MEISIKSLHLENFKGIKKLKVDFFKRTLLKGENESGKTRIADAFSWVLFGKDTFDRKDYEIKTFDENNNVIHGQENLAELTLLVDSKTIVLKRIYKEKWTKKTGEAERLLTGHTTSFYIDDVEVKKKEYDEFVGNMMDEMMFKLLSTNNYFNDYIDWKKRREIIMEFFVNEIPSDDEIAKSNNLKLLADYLSEKDIDSIIKQVKSKKALLNKEIKEIPVRVDELKKNEVDSILDTKAINEEIKAYKLKLQKLDIELSDLSNVSENLNNIYSEINKRKEKISQFQDAMKRKKEESVRKLYDTKADKLDKKRNVISSIREFEDLINNINADIKRLGDYRQELVKSYDEAKTSLFNEKDEYCPTCFAKLKPEKIKIIKEEFEINKKRKLAEIQKTGKENNDKILELKNNLIKSEKNYELAKALLEDVETEIKEIEVELERKSNEAIPDNSEDIKAMEIEIKALAEKIEKPSDSQQARKESILNEKKEINSKMEELNQLLLKDASNVNNELRISELMTRERELAQQIADLEKVEYSAELFIKKKVDLIEAKVSEKFPGVKFRLFKQLINGSLEECCETLVNGVPYSVLSNGAKIKCGLTIIQALQNHHNFKLPVFVDNSEGVTKELDIDTQLILMVAEKNCEFKVEEG